MGLSLKNQKNKLMGSFKGSLKQSSSTVNAGPINETEEDQQQQQNTIPHLKPPPSEESKRIDQRIKEETAIKAQISKQKDAMFAQVEEEKRMAVIKAWEDNEKTRVDNKFLKKVAKVDSWEMKMRAQVEAELKAKEELLENQKAKEREIMKNKISEIHREAEERKAGVEAKKGEDMLRAEAEAAKHRANGTIPKKKRLNIRCLSYKNVF